jgi:hypothetical protein
MADSKQWRVVWGRSGSSEGGAVFIDAPTEAAALAFFGAAFPGKHVVSVKLEPVDPCPQYEVRR